MCYDINPLLDWIERRDQCTAIETIEIRRCMIDTIACIAAGWSRPVSIGSVSPTLHRCPSPLSHALRLGSASHALDYDDSEVIGSTHPSAVLFAALIPLASQRGNSLAELHLAFVCGFEAIAWFCRVFGYRHYARGWHATATIAAFGAAAGCAKLLGFSARKTGYSLALIASFAGGLKTQFGSDGKAIHVGMASANALLLTSMVDQSLSGGKNCWDGPTGYMALHHATHSNAKVANQQLGKDSALESIGVVRKLYPCCHYTHRLIEGALAIFPEINQKMLLDVKLEMPEAYSKVVSQPAIDEDHQARFNVRYCVAQALQYGRVDVESFSTTSLGDSIIEGLMQKISLSSYPAENLEDLSPDAPDRITLTLENGDVVKRELRHVRGSAQLPVTDSQLSQKFNDSFQSVSAERSVDKMMVLLQNDNSSVIDISNIIHSFGG